MKRQIVSVIAGLAAAVALSAVAAGPAAQAVTPAGLPIGGVCQEVRDTSATTLFDRTYEVRLCGVTDVDQRRAGLVKNGNVHCGPTALYNSMDYLARRTGMPAKILSGQDITTYDPHDPADYAAATAWVGWLGYQAGINDDPTGSNLAENRAAFDAATSGAKAAGWLLSRGQFTASSPGNFGHEMAKHMLNAPVQLWFGNYAKNADGTYSRTGGHAVTVVAVKGDTSTPWTMELTLHDPARDDSGQYGYLNAQSPVTEEKVVLTRWTQEFKRVEKDGTVTDLGTRTYWRITGSGYSLDGKNHAAEAFNWFDAKAPVNG